MGLACQVVRDNKGAIEEVKAFNGASSNLFQAIITEHPELSKEEALTHYAKFYTEAFRNRYGDFTEETTSLETDVNGEPVYLQEALTPVRLSNRLQTGFLKDFNITVHELDAITKSVKRDGGSTASFIDKVMITPDTTDITKEAIFFAYMFLSKENGKLKSDLKYSISSWEKYNEKFEEYMTQITNIYGYIPDKKVWFNKVRDQIIIDFLEEEVIDYYNNPSLFEEVGREAWTRDEAKRLFEPNLMQRIVDAIKKFFANFSKGKNAIKTRIRLSNAAKNIAHEMITQEYRILDYQLQPDQLKTYYDSTIAKDPLAKAIVDAAGNNGLLLTGSLALRAQGDLYRTADEQLHDLDFNVPFEVLLGEKALLDELMNFRGNDEVFSMKAIEIVQKYQWYKDLKKRFPTIKVINSFNTFEDIHTVQAVIDGEFYTSNGKHEVTNADGSKKTVKHKKGDYIKGTGYVLDFFLRTQAKDEGAVNNFKHWRDIVVAKLMLNRGKDMVDHKHFTPYTMDVTGIDFSNPAFTYTRDLTVRDLPSPETVEEKATPHIPATNSNFAEYHMGMEGVFGEEISADQINQGVAIAELEELARQMNVDYEIISATEARHMTEDSLNPWNGQPAFFYNNKVYFIKNNITPEIALHEFSHPLVRYIKTVNRPLFNKLFNDLIQTPEGKQFLQEAIEEYGGIQDEAVTDAVKEEVIVKALTAKAVSLKANQPVTKKYNSIIGKILYHIKQALRKLFGSKVPVEKLDVNTSINDLAHMLVKGEKFNVNVDLVRQEDIVAYNARRKKLNDEVKGYVEKRKEELGVTIDEQFDAIKAQYMLVVNDPAFAELKPILANDAGRGYIAEMLKIKKFTTAEELSPETREALEGLDEVEYFHKKVTALIDNLLIQEVMIDKVNKHLKSFKDLPDKTVAMREMFNYNKLIQIWKQQLDATKTDFENLGAEVENESLMELIGNMSAKIDAIDSMIMKTYADGLSDIILMMNPINDVLEKNFQAEKERLENLIKNSQGKARESYERRLKEEEYKYEQTRLDEDKLKLYLAGATKSDNHFLNAYLLNYIGNPDPIVGSFGKFLKDAMNDVAISAHLKYNNFVDTMDEKMKKVGLRATNLKKLADELLFTDRVGWINPETMEVDEYMAHTFLNNFQDYKYALVELSNRVRRAKEAHHEQGTEESEEIYAKALAARQKHLQLYFQSKYKDEIYEIDQRLMDQTRIIDGKEVHVGAIAKERIDADLREIHDIEVKTVYEDKYESVKEAETKAALWRKYAQHFSKKDEYGKPKTGLDLAIAEVLTEHRKYKQKFYEWKKVQGAFETAFEALENELIVKLKQEMGDEAEGTQEFKDEFERRRKEWLDVNTRTKLTQDFYDTRAKMLDRIKEIFDSLEQQRAAKGKKWGYKKLTRFSEVYEDINDVMTAKRDDDGQPVGTLMTDAAIAYIKEQQEEMAEAKKEFISLSGLTSQEYEIYQSLWDKIKTKDPMTGQNYKLNDEEQKTFDKLNAKKGDLGLDEGLKAELVGLWRGLELLQSKIPTEYYMDIADRHYKKFIRPNMEDGPADLTLEGAADMLDPNFIDQFLLMEGNEEFKEWFEANHIETEKWDEVLKEKVPYYERVHAWNVVRPNDPKYYETTTIKREDGTEFQVDGVPTLKYYYRTVKPEYMTGYNPKTKQVELEIGVHQDNQGNWLPRSYEEMQEKQRTNPELFSAEEPFDKYINKRYMDLKAKAEANPGSREAHIFDILETLKDFHLEHQSELGNNQKLGYELPRYRKDNYQYFGAGKLPEDTWGGKLAALGKDLMDSWRVRKDDYQTSGLNYQDDWAYTKAASVFSNIGSPIPLTGRYKLEEDRVSTDIMQSMMMHMMSIEQHNKLKETQPIAAAFKKLINEYDPSHVKDIWRKTQGPHAPLPEANKKHRMSAVNAIYEVWWEGKQMKTGKVGKDYTRAIKITNNLLGMASHAFFAWDLTSAMKNYLGAQFQIGTEALLGATYTDENGKKQPYINYGDYWLGRAWALKVNALVHRERYAETSKSLEMQLMEVWDPSQGRQAEMFGMSPSRSLGRDIANFKFTTTHRKWLELLGTNELWAAILHSVRVEQTINGQTKEIRYVDAWQLNPDTNNIELKEGIDESWGLGGKNFNTWKNRMHELSNLNQGMYSKMDSSQANRYLAFKAVISMRKFFTKMFLNRYSVKAGEGFKIYKPSTWERLYEKWDPALEDFHMGYYARSLKTIGRLANSNMHYWNHMTKDEKRALMRLAFEPIKVYLWKMLVMALFGLWDWDPDDPDRWKKMRERSGALPSFWTDDEYEKNFDLWGFTQNHALLLMLNTNQENTFFLPWVPGQQLELFGETSVANTATLGAYSELASMIAVIYDDEGDGYYKKDTGAMWYQQEGMWKGWKILAKMMGHKGKFTDPVTSAKNFQGAINR